MNRDPMDALESYFAHQSVESGRTFGEQVHRALSEECQDVDLTPVVAGVRKALPAAAAIIFGVISPSVSRQEVQSTARSIEKARLEGPSSVPTELENPWQDSI